MKNAPLRSYKLIQNFKNLNFFFPNFQTPKFQVCLKLKGKKKRKKELIKIPTK